MLWKDLSDTAKSILEQCFSLYRDSPRIFTMIVNKESAIPYYGKMIMTEENYQEIKRFVEEEEKQYESDPWHSKVVRVGNTVYIYGVDKELKKENVTLFLTGKDFHNTKCDCGVCNTNGHAYGCSVYKVVDNQREEEPDYVFWGPDKDIAIHTATQFCVDRKYNILEKVGK